MKWCKQDVEAFPRSAAAAAWACRDEDKGGRLRNDAESAVWSSECFVQPSSQVDAAEEGQS